MAEKTDARADASTGRSLRRSARGHIQTTAGEEVEETIGPAARAPYGCRTWQADKNSAWWKWDGQSVASPCPSELHKIYRVLPDEDASADGDIRVIDESGED